MKTFPITSSALIHRFALLAALCCFIPGSVLRAADTPPKPQPPPIPYRFIGYLGPPEGKIAVLHDGTDFLFVRQGEEIGQGIKVLEIGYESVKFGFTDPQFKGESRTIPMSSSL